jgi:hypothetical protein
MLASVVKFYVQSLDTLALPPNGMDLQVTRRVWRDAHGPIVDMIRFQL